ncbi:hypothetical protein ATER59S_02481 [Aquamicrobium terrae]
MAISATIPHRNGGEPDFYLPVNASYGIIQSASDGIRYALSTLRPMPFGRNAPSFLTDSRAEAIRSAGRLIQGIGYCADAGFAVGALHRFGMVFACSEALQAARDIAQHIFATGYFADGEIPVRLYRDTETGEFFDQVEARSDYFDLGHMARPLEKLLMGAEALGAAQREVLAITSKRLVDWVHRSEKTADGWLPRRLGHDLKMFKGSRLPAGLPKDATVGLRPFDPTMTSSGAGLLVVAFLIAVGRAGIASTAETVSDLCASFVAQGGCFGSINTDSDDPEESVAYALGFQALLDASGAVSRPEFRDFAYDVCLAGLRRFQISADVNGHPVKGLLRLASSYSSTCFWENAEVALAYFKAAVDARDGMLARHGMTVLRGIARCRSTETGFLPAEYDWDGRLPPGKHVPAAPTGPRAVTHPFMNNLNALAPTLFYLDAIASRSGERFFDLEGNQL